ncbi:MAG: 16S rRNA (adenine(1518)-N(6)/adenine(1519)-N(6))-dimethyltransferase RsmA [Patescibacteria group bacterium]|jgi:16S rRNA (adenine1518-N6/adenine1519-N6)-dimethyltransferase
MIDLTNISLIKSLLKIDNSSPDRRMGQNFLISSKSLERISNSTELEGQTVLEIGTGLGVLTQELCKKAKRVISVEKDERMYNIAKDVLIFDNLTLLNEDILDFEVEKYISGEFKIVANIPYQITSPIIRKFLPNKNLTEMILLMQKEVAERICAKPGSSKRGYLTLVCEFYSDPSILFGISKNCFWPSPKVDSSVVKFKVPLRQSPERRVYEDINAHKVDEKELFRIVQAGFSSKRKQLLNSLSAGLRCDKSEIENILNKVNIIPTRRAETLTLEEWCLITKKIPVN